MAFQRECRPTFSCSFHFSADTFLPMRYAAYGLVFQSELFLPELLEHNGDKPEQKPDVTIVLGDIPADGLTEGEQIGPFLWVHKNQLWLEVPDVARFWVRDGQEIIVQPFDGIDDDSVRVFLLGSALGALLFQRGFLVLHGNAIKIGNSCMICVGQSGAGKSTLAAGFIQRGYSMLSDDVVPVDEQCRAWPGFPRLKLWQDTADKLGIDTKNLTRIRPELEKYHYPVHEQFANEPLTVRWIYILNSHREPNMLFEPIRGMQRFQPLRNNTYRMRFLDGMALKAEHLQLCGKLAGSIHLTRVTRPEKGFELDKLMDTLLEHTSQNP